MPPLGEPGLLIRLIAVVQTAIRSATDARSLEADRLKTRLTASPLGHLAGQVARLIPPVHASKLPDNWPETGTGFGTLEAESARAFAAECLPLFWVESARLVRQMRRLLNHSDDHLRTIREAGDYRRRLRESPNAELAGLFDRLDSLFNDSVSGRTTKDPACIRLAEALERLLATAGPAWPVNQLLRLAALRGAGDWFDGLTPTRAEFSTGSPPLALAEWLAGHLPDRSLHPAEPLEEIFRQLSGGRIRVCRMDEVPAPEPGWAAGPVLRRANGWLARAMAAEPLPEWEAQLETAEPVPDDEPEPDAGRVVPPPVPAAPKSSLPDDVPKVFASLAAEFRLATVPSARRAMLEKYLQELAAARDLPPDKADAVLKTARELAGEDGLTVLPADWSPARPVVWKAVPPGVTAQWKYMEQAPKGTVTAVLQYALKADEEAPATPAKAEVCLGAMPAGVSELWRTLMEHRSETPAFREVRERVKSWSSHVWEGRFEEELRRFFVDYHADLGDAWRTEDMAGYDAVRAALVDVLRRNFGYKLYEPSVREHSELDWMVLVGNRTPRTKQIRRIIQPGLFDARNRLILTARVEME